MEEIIQENSALATPYISISSSAPPGFVESQAIWQRSSTLDHDRQPCGFTSGPKRQNAAEQVPRQGWQRPPGRLRQGSRAGSVGSFFVSGRFLAGDSRPSKHFHQGTVSDLLFFSSFLADLEAFRDVSRRRKCCMTQFCYVDAQYTYRPRGQTRNRRPASMETCRQLGTRPRRPSRQWRGREGTLLGEGGGPERAKSSLRQMLGPRVSRSTKKSAAAWILLAQAAKREPTPVGRNWSFPPSPSAVAGSLGWLARQALAAAFHLGRDRLRTSRCGQSPSPTAKRAGRCDAISKASLVGPLFFILEARPIRPPSSVARPFSDLSDEPRGLCSLPSG